jgi:signal peptidase I
MTKQAQKKTNESDQPQHRRSAMMYVISIGLFILGMLVWYYNQKLGPSCAEWFSNPDDWKTTLTNWFWYSGVTFAVAGALAFVLSGMPREHALEWIRSGVFALVLALLIRWPIAEPYRIPSGSMEPTLLGDPALGKGDRVFVNKWVYGVRYPFMNKRIWHGASPNRWDVVVFKAVEKNALHGTLVKRIVGMPGERIHIAEDKKIYVNGEELEIPDFMPAGQSYTTPPGYRRLPDGSSTSKYYGIAQEDEYSLIPEGHYLVLGDNSANSRDGRWFGWLPNEHIVGRVSSIWWPPASWRDFTGFSQTLWWRALIFLLGIWIFVRLFIGRSFGMAGKNNKTEHVFVYFLAFGLRIPFTPWRALKWGIPQRGDLVLYHPSDEVTPDGEPLIGRVAGMPGETVVLNDGVLHVNGAQLSEPVSLSKREFPDAEACAIYGRGKNKKNTTVPEGRYFILSDQEGDAQEVLDSRTLGWVSQGDMIGRGTNVWWPLSRARRIQ